MNWQRLTAKDGTIVPIYIVDATGSQSALCLLMPALGVPAKFYRKLASALAENGVTTAVLEQRGNGESPYRAYDGSQFALGDYLDVDLEMTYSWLREYAPDVPFYIGGHSLGGHVASLFAARYPERFSGIIHFACGIPYPADFPLVGHVMIKIFAGLVPLTAKLFGYFPGKKLGFAGSEYAGLMQDWRQWTQLGTYNIDGLSDSEMQMSEYTGHLLSISIAKDNMMTKAAIERACKPLKKAKVTSVFLGPDEQGTFLGHINWARKPNGAVSAVLKWLESHL